MEASIPTDPNQFALFVLQNATSGNYRVLVALALMGVVFVIRQWVLRPTAFGRFARLAWFKTDRGGVALNFIVSALGGAGNAFISKQSFTKQLLLSSMVNACIAAGVFVSIKRLMGKPVEPPAAAAATAPTEPAADASITTTTTMGKPK